MNTPFSFSYRMSALLVSLIFSVGLMSQSVNEGLGTIQAPSPEASSIARFVETPVNIFTGVPNITIPVHTVQEGPLSHSISLSYHAGGIRASEAASWVGLGWNLNVGGMISRTVLGLPDESTNGYLDNDYDYTNSSVISDVADGLKDGEPDLFMFSVDGMSGKFIINRDFTTNEIDIIQYPASDIKIEVVDDDLNEFLIISPNGTRYLFGENQLDSEYHGTVESGNIANAFTQGSGPANSKSATGGTIQRIEWYLRKIQTHDEEFEINFDYRRESYLLVTPSFEQRIVTNGFNSFSGCLNDDGCNPFDELESIFQILSECISEWCVSSNSGYAGTILNRGDYVIQSGQGQESDKYASDQIFNTSKISSITGANQIVA